MRREFLKGFELEKDTIDAIMSEVGKEIESYKSEIDSYKEKIATYESEVSKLQESSKNNDEWKQKFESLTAEVQKKDAEIKAKAEEEALTNNIISSFGDKKFCSDYAKNGLIADIKSELNKTENKGKSISEITDYLTKDKTGIFEVPNQAVNIPPMGSVNDENNIKDMPVLW